ncbi:MAG: hypothetical protein N4A53_01970 [Pelagimonas sp.]|jgi:Ca2+-binding RTX toxin-like protein|nr:hypothetical protein [Pelagimonas sp.]
MGGFLLLLLGGLALSAMSFGAGGSDSDDGENDDGVRRDGDTIIGTEGDDVIFGSEDPELILPGPGDDFVRAGAEGDIIVDGDVDDPNHGNDTLYGGAGADEIRDRGGNDQLFGGTGEDLLIAVDFGEDAPHAPDTVNGGYGDDTVAGDDGDLLIGGAGVDQYVIGINNAGDATVNIEDFTAGEEILIEIYDDSLPNTPEAFTAGLTIEDQQDGVSVSVNGTELAYLRGASSAEVDAGLRIALFNGA